MDVLPKELQNLIYFYVFDSDYNKVLKEILCIVSSKITNVWYIRRCGCGKWMRNLTGCRPCQLKKIEKLREELRKLTDG